MPCVVGRRSELPAELIIRVARALVDNGHFTLDSLPTALRDFECDIGFEGTSPVSVGWTCALWSTHLLLRPQQLFTYAVSGRQWHARKGISGIWTFPPTLAEESGLVENVNVLAMTNSWMLR